MGRPIKSRYLGTQANGAPAVHQIQALVYGAADSGSTAGYLTAQNSPHRFRSTTVNGTNLTTLSSTPLSKGQAAVKVFPIAGYPTTYATANATLGVVGNAAVVIGGSGYHVGDYVTLVGGTYGLAANVKVLANAAGGAVTSLSAPVNAIGTQLYTALPANIANIATANSIGSGTGLTVAANFGLDSSWILTGGAGYAPSSSATVAYETNVGLAEATVTNPTTTGGGAVTTGKLTITNSGILNTLPTITVENDTQGTVEYAKIIASHYVNTYSGNQYKWLHRGANVPADYATLGVKLAYLDTL